MTYSTSTKSQSFSHSRSEVSLKKGKKSDDEDELRDPLLEKDRIEGRCEASEGVIFPSELKSVNAISQA